ncbi:MAG: hypothetical protein IT269_05210 [Saprospiraceae bacterium]|nr:hypothetical protein [Saprospiraceae bacterium]
MDRKRRFWIAAISALITFGALAATVGHRHFHHGHHGHCGAYQQECQQQTAPPAQE